MAPVPVQDERLPLGQLCAQRFAGGLVETPPHGQFRRTGTAAGNLDTAVGDVPA